MLGTEPPIARGHDRQSVRLATVWYRPLDHLGFDPAGLFLLVMMIWNGASISRDSIPHSTRSEVLLLLLPCLAILTSQKRLVDHSSHLDLSEWLLPYACRKDCTG